MRAGLKMQLWEFIFYGTFEQQVPLAPLLPSLNVDVCCSGAPRTTEAAPAISPGSSYTYDSELKVWTQLVLAPLARHYSNDILRKTASIVHVTSCNSEN